ncbi:hypothetical protein BC343_20435 [Mucilaginibacter pedocola]|uniref:Uncharacterized protein n=1 Tax=Mucilaginibacter pedocola TaxID=1792845 RepID=A0A1S9PKL2_9SPHI|nr:hypothetical protein BC343_20435 [Mucilaginibacter pedocola]
MQADIDNIVPNKENLEEQIKRIQDATSAAESLPTDLAQLKDARLKIDSMSTEAASAMGKIGLLSEAAAMSSVSLKAREEEAIKIVAQCQEAYRIATSTGLAGAFDDRAKRLSSSMWGWVALLLISLTLGGCLGTMRYDSLTKVLDVSKPSWGIIAAHVLLSLFSLAAPVWFAWISTKQIGQRFRLSEDYAFKASVAKAYEGYRREAARIDPIFESRLFGSALTRLEELPLRLVEGDNHGSPWQELISSDGFQKALQTIPELRDKFMNMPKDIVASFGNVKKTISPESAKTDE